MNERNPFRVWTIIYDGIRYELEAEPVITVQEGKVLAIRWEEGGVKHVIYPGAATVHIQSPCQREPERF